MAAALPRTVTTSVWTAALLAVPRVTVRFSPPVQHPCFRVQGLTSVHVGADHRPLARVMHTFPLPHPSLTTPWRAEDPVCDTPTRLGTVQGIPACCHTGCDRTLYYLPHAGHPGLPRSDVCRSLLPCPFFGHPGALLIFSLCLSQLPLLGTWRSQTPCPKHEQIHSHMPLLLWHRHPWPSTLQGFLRERHDMICREHPHVWRHHSGGGRCGEPGG